MVAGYFNLSTNSQGGEFLAALQTNTDRSPVVDVGDCVEMKLSHAEEMCRLLQSQNIDRVSFRNASEGTKLLLLTAHMSTHAKFLVELG